MGNNTTKKKVTKSKSKSKIIPNNNVNNYSSINNKDNK